MRNAKVLSVFYEKVQTELDKACQAVFDKYQAEFEQKVYNQLCDGDTLYQANGTALIINKNGAHVGDEFTTALAQFQYPFGLNAGFEITYKIHINEALRQPPVSGSLPDANPHTCPECSWLCDCSDQPCSCCSGNAR